MGNAERSAVCVLIGACLLLAQCAIPSDSADDSGIEPGTVRYLALGDSYTIGQSVDVDQTWPVLLAQALRTQGYDVQGPTIIARTGWTTDELMAGIEQEGPQGTFDLVSLLIGVNNQYRGWDIEAYREEFRVLLEQAIAFAGGDPERVIVLSIPDWGVTPYAAGWDRSRIAAEIDRLNATNREETEGVGARYVDVTEVSREAAAEEDWLAPDGLHPSGKMYAAWARLVLPEAVDALSGGD